MQGKYHPISIRIQALALLHSGIDIEHIMAATGMSCQAIQYWDQKAKKRGFNPAIDPRILMEYVEDSRRSGRPKIAESTQNALIEAVKKDRDGREKSSEILAFEYLISASSAWRILKLAGFHSVKPTTKPGLTNEIKKKRLEFCLAHQDWTLEDWKNVIFTDETSVCLGQRCGGVRVWRRYSESHEQSVIRRCWSGYKEFMVWGCFSYDKKGPLHIYLSETAQQKKAAAIEIEALNLELEPKCREEWELQVGMGRLKLRNGCTPGRAPIFAFTKKTGRLKRDSKSKGGIDWYRYYHEVLIPKLIPFAKEYMIERPNTIILEDRAPPHSHHFQ